MTKPITFAEAVTFKAEAIPPFVFDVWNRLIVANFSNGRSSFKLNALIEAIIEASGEDITRSYVVDQGWCDLEDAYRAAGWAVEFDKPGYNESYAAFFTFKAKAP